VEETILEVEGPTITGRSRVGMQAEIATPQNLWNAVGPQLKISKMIK
jgi:hypothetical protein